MTVPDDPKREDQVLDALIVAALRQDLEEDVPLPDLTDPEPILSPEDQQALDALGTDLVARIMTGPRMPRPQPRPKGHRRGRPSKPRLMGSLHRGEEESELTDEAREEMERKIRELDNQDEGTSPP